MRKRAVLAVLLAAIAALALAACGSSSSSGSPTSTALSYFPSGSPFLIKIATDPSSAGVKQAQGLVAKVPLIGFGEAALTSRLQQVGISYDSDIRPLFGNPIVAGLATSSPAQARSSFLLAWVTKDEGTLKRLIGKVHLQSTESYRGAALYHLPPVTMAIAGATLLLAGTDAEIKAALDRHAGGGGTTEAAFDQATAGLSTNPLLAVAGSLSAVLSTPRAAKARRVPWVAAIRSYGVTMAAGSSGIDLRYRIDTSRSQLAPSQLPVAIGSTPPLLAGTMPIQVGLREPATTLAFALQAEQAASPSKYAADIARMNAVKRKTGVDFRQDVLGQVGQNAAIQSDGHVFMIRVDVMNPKAAQDTLRKLGTSALDVLGTHSGETVARGPGGFETVHRTGGKKSILFGIVGSEFVAGDASPDQLHAFASAPTTPASGAQGAAAFRVSLASLIRLGLASGPVPKVAQQVLGSLGDLTGWLAATPGQLTGSATLAVK